MSVNRDKRRQDRNRAKKSAAKSKPRKVRELPWRTLGIAVGVVGLVGLLAYLMVQSSSDPGETSDVPEAALDDSPDIAGTYAPFLGVQHLEQQLDVSYTPIVPYCEGVQRSGIREAATPDGTQQAGTPTPPATATNATSGGTTTASTPTPDASCYNSNPPTSGRHFGVQRNKEIAPGAFTNVPPEPNVYPPDIDAPREVVAHVAEHAGIFVGYNCPEGNQACLDVVAELEDVVNNRIDNHDNRVTMMYFSDLPEGQIGLASITRWDRFSYNEFDEDRVENFISDNACRYDTEGFC